MQTKKNMKKISLLATVAVVAVIGIVSVSMFFSYNNREISLRKEAEAQEKKIEAVYDKMWKVITQKAQVSEDYKDSFHDIYKDIIGGRYANGDGSLMKWITESNPQFDASIYKDLMTSIEVLRSEFTTNQERMLDIIREHETLINTYPSKWFISNKEKIAYEVISSSIAKEVMQTRSDDNVSVFGDRN